MRLSRISRDRIGLPRIGFSRIGLPRIGLSLAVVCFLIGGPVHAQEFHLWSPADLFGNSRSSVRIPTLDDRESSGGPSSAARLQMLGMPAGFLVNPIGIMDD